MGNFVGEVGVGFDDGRTEGWSEGDVEGRFVVGAEVRGRWDGEVKVGLKEGETEGRADGEDTDGLSVGEVGEGGLVGALNVGPLVGILVNGNLVGKLVVGERVGAVGLAEGKRVGNPVLNLINPGVEKSSKISIRPCLTSVVSHSVLSAGGSQDTIAVSLFTHPLSSITLDNNTRPGAGDPFSVANFPKHFQCPPLCRAYSALLQYLPTCVSQ